MRNTKIFCLAVACLAFTTTAFAATVPYHEEFDANVANWADAGSTPLIWNAAGGADGGHAFGQFNFMGTDANTDVIVLRGSQALGSSDGEFFGDWLSDGVTNFSAMIRHDAGVPLTFFVRFTSPANFPGAIALNFAPVPSDNWTMINVPIASDNPQFISFESQDFDSVFDGIGAIQFGVRTPEQLAGVDTDITFSLDSVSIVPEPATLAMLVLGTAGVAFRRRK